MSCAFGFEWGSLAAHERRAATLMTKINKLPFLGMIDSIYLAGQKAAMFELPPFDFLQHLNHFGVTVARMGYVDEMRRIRGRFDKTHPSS